jgi:hypothetical protein
MEQEGGDLSNEDAMDLPDEMDYSAAEAVDVFRNQYGEEEYNQNLSDKAPSSDELRSARKLENANNAVSNVKANID